MRRLGRAGGLARAEQRRRQKARSWKDAVREKVEADPDAFAARLLESAAGSAIAARLLGAGSSPTPRQEEEVSSSSAVASLI